ncbi:hypothetical protein GGR52DRAFT_138112 [Hypoxylon sp. FL1284]|nr:hypothetical protein GGR52DRAFT_138112 [Hypoxylon sp. FL1284]
MAESEQSTDGLTALERHKKEILEAEDKIIHDDKLDEPAKIDAFCRLRHWFCADTRIVDAYMAGAVDLIATVAKVAEPIEHTYTTADQGRTRYKEEMLAREQRKYHSPEKALDMGPEQDIPEPDPDTEDLPTTEGQLMELWYGILHASKRIPWTDDARQNKLLDLVKAFKARPDPPRPNPLTIPLRRH